MGFLAFLPFFFIKKRSCQHQMFFKMFTNLYLVFLLSFLKTFFSTLICLKLIIFENRSKCKIFLFFYFVSFYWICIVLLYVVFFMKWINSNWDFFKFLGANFRFHYNLVVDFIYFSAFWSPFLAILLLVGYSLCFFKIFSANFSCSSVFTYF